VRIDYLGATLIAAGVSVLLVWVSFVDSSFAWASWQTAVMVAGGLALLAAALWVESRASEPVVPLAIVKQRTTALAILGSLAVGTAMFGSSVFLSQYFQLSRGHSPTEAGLLTIPMMAGILVASTVAGRLISRTGKIKPFVVVGAALLTLGLAGLGTIDHKTSIVFLSASMLCVGMGVGMTLQNFILAVQNSVQLKDIGSASSTVTFFRSLGGTIGVSVLGAVLARHVHDQVAHGLASAGLPGGGSNPGGAAQPPAVREIIRVAYGDATAQVFLLSAGAAVLALVAAILLKPVSLRSSLDLPEKAAGAVVAAEAVTGVSAPDRAATDLAQDEQRPSAGESTKADG
jgi:MFS family permease